MNLPTVADFVLPATGNSEFRLSAHRGHPVVLYFYPKDNTPGCTNEGIAFRDLHAEFLQLGCVIAGVSRDTLKSHESFRAKYEFPFVLLSDTEEKLCTQLGVIKFKNMYGKQVRGIERSTFLIDQNGRLAREWRGVKVAGHAEEVLAAALALRA
ncbi:MAG: peroxiredoxin [Betaproteobacteria bacterium]|nr:peroxiredoxin [Betaproteobacteria bacterium]